MTRTNVLRLPATEVRQGREHLRYTFAVAGELIPSCATRSRIQRKRDNRREGYQRPEVLSHTAESGTDRESDAPMIPNAIVIAFDRRVRFEPNQDATSNISYTRIGVIVIPIDEEVAAEEKPGFIVDGQQRIAAIRDAE